MQIKVRCLSCGKTYICHQGNTKIFGPIIDTTCPMCRNKTSKNYSAFLEAQTENIMVGHYAKHNEKARIMITLAQAISKVISNEEAFRKKK